DQRAPAQPAALHHGAGWSSGTRAGHPCPDSLTTTHASWQGGDMTSDSDESASGYDVIVIGVGPVGENVADQAVRGGLSVAMVEDRLAGGECSYWACIPTKALLRPVQVLAEARRLPSTSPAITGPLEVRAALARRDEATKHLDDSGQVDWLTSVPV